MLSTLRKPRWNPLAKSRASAGVSVLDQSRDREFAKGTHHSTHVPFVPSTRLGNITFRQAKLGFLRALLYACLTIAIVSMFPLRAHALWPDPVDLKSCVQAAGVIFAGTVIDLKYEPIPGAVVTKITFGKLNLLKGDGTQPTITLTFFGGHLDGRAIWEMDEPTYEMGERYVLLVKQDLGSKENLYSPIVFGDQGYFKVVSPRKGGRSQVVDSHGRYLMELHGDHLVVLGLGAGITNRMFYWDHRAALEVTPGNRDTGARLSEDSLVTAIRQIVQER